MRFLRFEQVVAAPEPQVFGVQIDPESAALYDEFAQGRSLDDVYGVWKDPAVTNPTIRQRATAVLTAPHGYDVPYPHTDQSIGRLLHISEEVNGEKTSSLRERFRSKPALARELAQGLLYWLDTTGGHMQGSGLDSRYDYQSAIQHLLPIVDEESADRLFAHYQINDIESYWDIDSASGYQPIMDLLVDQEVPRRYKDAGLAQWFSVAVREEQGMAQPREEHERAIKRLAEFVKTWTYGKGVDDDIHTAIITFLEDHVPAGATYAESYVVRRVADHLTDEDVKFRFAWRHLVVGSDKAWDHFRVENDEDRVFLEWVQGEAHRRGMTQFDAKAELLIQQYEVKRRERVAAEAAELALRARLRA